MAFEKVVAQAHRLPQADRDGVRFHGSMRLYKGIIEVPKPPLAEKAKLAPSTPVSGKSVGFATAPIASVKPPRTPPPMPNPEPRKPLRKKRVI
jgi:hypothetical protein